MIVRAEMEEERWKDKVFLKGRRSVVVRILCEDWVPLLTFEAIQV